MVSDRPTPHPWPPVLLVVSLVGAWILTRYWPLPWPGLNDAPARVVGMAFGVIGLCLVGWGLWTLQQHNTTVLPHDGASTLVTSGPFRYLRNPIYLGDVFIMFGLAEVTKSIWFVIAAILFAVAVTRLAIKPEERHLEARFGDAYLDYKSQTRRWI